MTETLTRQCDIGGDYHYPHIPGPAVYRERCANPVTHRWHTSDMADGWWNYRCATHIKILSSTLPGLKIEEIK